MDDKIIYNCHNHIFTHENVPNNFFPLYLVSLTRLRAFRWLLNTTLKVIVPWSNSDKIQRLSAFIKATYRKSQEQNLTHLMGYYPEGTRFIILPMDMAYMGAGKVKEDIDAQHREIARLLNDQKYADLIIPFAHIDPRRPDALARLKSLIENDNFRGVKIYPTLGYRPDHKVLMNEIYPYMVDKNLPLMAHCSPGSVNSKDMSRQAAHALADPDNYRSVMETHPDLKVCLGHFGGIDEWRRHINDPRDIQNPTWLTKITALIKSEKYPNLFADISYTIFNFQENIPYLKILLEDDAILNKTLFGSDFYMVENQKYSEKRLSTDLRYALGEDKFWKIANANPKRYLGTTV